MNITFGGCRGTRPLHEERFARYGGATTSVLVQGDAGEMIVIDCGSGLANVEAKVMASAEPLLMLFTHLHIDHMLGLPSFRALHQEGKQISLAGPDQTGAACRSLLSPPYWPLDLDSFPADIHDLTLQPIDIDAEPNSFSNNVLNWGQLTVSCLKVVHPGSCLAYRIDEKSTGHSFLFATDMEWGLMGEKHRNQFLQFGSYPSKATVLAMDGHFKDEEYSECSGWGHSTQEEVVQIGQTMGCDHFFITHHSPENDDQELDKRLQDVKKLDNRANFVTQGMKVELT